MFEQAYLNYKQKAMFKKHAILTYLSNKTPAKAGRENQISIL